MSNTESEDESEGMEEANPPHPFIKVEVQGYTVAVYSTKSGPRTCGEHGMNFRVMR